MGGKSHLFSGKSCYLGGRSYFFRFPGMEKSHLFGGKFQLVGWNISAFWLEILCFFGKSHLFGFPGVANLIFFLANLGLMGSQE